MILKNILRGSLSTLLIGMFLTVGGSSAFAAGESLYIQNLYPTGAINPGSTVTFTASASGFIDPQFSMSDTSSASSATSGTLDKYGFFTWTPTVYDAGRHLITVTATDKYNHAASSTVDILVASNAVLVTNISPGIVIALHHPVTFTITAPGFITPNYAVYDSYGISSLRTDSTLNASGIFSWTPTTIDDIGLHTLSVRASDIYGHSAQTTQPITVINPSVSIQGLFPGGSAGIGSDVSFKAVASALATTTYNVTDSFFGTTTVTTDSMNASTGVFSWQPTTADLGLHTFVVTASDAYGNTASTTASVLITNASPTFAPSTLPTQPSSTASVLSVSSPSTEPVSTYVFTKNLWIGSKGAEVLALQKYLTTLGFYSGPQTGYYGPLTSGGVKNFQKAHAIIQVGVVGPLTRAALNHS